MAAQPPRHYHPMVEKGTNVGVGGGGAAYLYHPLAVAGDTTYTKIFVGGLAWETQRDTMRRYFEQFGDILEAVVITDKHTGRSKGYGFVTFTDPDSAVRACQDPTPVIDGRRANCNLASLGAVQRPRHQPPPPPAYGVGPARFRPAMASSALRGSSPASSFPAYYRPPAQYPYPYSFYGYSGGYSQESMYPMTFYGFGGGGAQAQPISAAAYYPAAGQGFAPSIYPYYTQIAQASQPQAAGIGLHYAQGHSYTPYYPQNYGSGPGILSLPIASPNAAGPVGVQFSDGNAGVRASPPSSSG